MANDFSGDSNLKLYCKFESGALEDCEVNGADFLTNVNTVGEAMDVTVINGRTYVADNMGGIALLK